MSQVYEIYADEAWTHVPPTPQKQNRYWHFFGGVFGSHADPDRLEKALTKIKVDFGNTGEVKWTKIFAGNIKCYEALVDFFFASLDQNDIRYRQIFLDRKFVYVNEDKKILTSHLELQFKIYYQFLKHSFGLQHLPEKNAQLLIHLDKHSCQNLTESLKGHVEDLPRVLKRPDLRFNVHYLNSARSSRVQICDLLLGAAGFYGNKHYMRRQPNKRGMSDKQKLRNDLAKKIYNKFRECDARHRGTKAFNWFETTGYDLKDPTGYKRKIAIWKLIPQKHKVDKGWENDHLDAQGRYQGPHLENKVDVTTEDEW